MPKVSVIMPVYNVAPYLRKGAASVLNQTLRDIELILVDDGSTDGSSAICDEIAALDSRVKVIHQPNGGLSRARNAGLAIAQAPFVFFCDSDDVIADETCSALFKEMQTRGVDVVRCGVEIVRGSLGTCPSVGDDLFDLPMATGTVVTCDKALDVVVDAVVWNKLYRREVFKRFALAFADGIVHEDFGFTLKYFMVADRMSFVADRFYKYQLRTNGIMGAKARSLSGACGYLESLEDAYRFMVNHGLQRTRGGVFWRAFVRGFRCAVEDCPEDDVAKLYDRARDFLGRVEIVGACGHVRSLLADIVVGRRMTRRHGLGPLTLVKVTNRPDLHAIRICGIPVWRKRYS